MSILILQVQIRIIISTIMSDVDQLANLINGILQAEDKAKRESAEQTLVSLRASNPNELMLAFLIILAGQYPVSLRNFSASQLRLCLSSFSPASYTNLWDNLTQQNQILVKSKLFEVLFAEQDSSMKKHIADTLGQIAGSVLSKDVNAWPQFKPHVWQLFKQPSGAGILPGFYVLESFLPFCPDVFAENSDDLLVLFQSGLRHENNKIKLSALNAFSSYLEILEDKEQKKFKNIIVDILNAVYALLVSQQSDEEGLQILTEMLDVDHKFFKQNFKELNALLQSVFKLKNIEGGVRRMATQTLVDYAQKSPAIFRKNKQYLQELLHMIFAHMIEIDDEITEQWKKPAQGYNDDMEDDQDFETTRFGMGAIDRIIYSVGDKEVLPILSESIKELLKNPDWRYQYTAIMALSQIGQYMEDASHISSIIQMILQYFQNPNPMLRYASCHAIGQISDDLKPKYQELYGKQTYPKLVHLLKDPVPRVTSHSAAALTNFLEGVKYEQALPLLDEMMHLLVTLSSTGISLVKESCLGAISSVAELCKDNFSKYLEITVQLLFHIIETNTSKQYKQLRGQAIETLTIIASSVGPVSFRPALEKLVLIMIHIQQSKFEQTDPQKSYILAGWQRLCLVYGQELSNYLNRILPSLFELVQNVINNELNLVKNPDSIEQKEDQKQSKQQTINTFETEEAEVAISMLNVFIEQLKELYAPYVQQTVHLLCKIIQEHPNDDVRQTACRCLPSLVGATKQTNKEGAISLTRYFMKTLVQTIEKESDPSVVCLELETLKDIIENLDLCFLNSVQIEEFSKKMLTMMSESQKSKQVTKDFMKKGEDLDEEETELFNQQIKQEEEVQVSISQVFGVLFKTHQDMTLPLAQHLITQVLPSVLKPGLSENTYKFAIFMIDDMVEYLGYDRLSKHWQEFGKVLIGFCTQKSCELRQAACYGLGIYAEKTPTNIPNIIEVWLQALIESSKIQKGTEKQKTYGHCRDNAISSIGKVIKAHGESFNCVPYVNYWFTFLPLRFDKPEALIQHQFLVDIMLNKPELILGTAPEYQLQNLIKVLHVYGTILNNHKLFNETIKNKMKTHIYSLQSLPLFSANNEHIWKQLGQKQKESLVKLTQSN